MFLTLLLLGLSIGTNAGVGVVLLAHLSILKRNIEDNEPDIWTSSDTTVEKD